MNNETPKAFIAVREYPEETDAIVFRTEKEMRAFCRKQKEYIPIVSGLHTLTSALEIFE